MEFTCWAFPLSTFDQHLNQFPVPTDQRLSLWGTRQFRPVGQPRAIFGTIRVYCVEHPSLTDNFTPTPRSPPFLSKLNPPKHLSYFRKLTAARDHCQQDSHPLACQLGIQIAPEKWSWAPVVPHSNPTSLDGKPSPADALHTACSTRYPTSPYGTTFPYSTSHLLATDRQPRHG